jgi:hypothetical protein
MSIKRAGNTQIDGPASSDATVRIPLVSRVGGATMVPVPSAPYPLPPIDPALAVIAGVLDPVLSPLGFAPGSVGVSGERGSVTFCRGDAHSGDEGCVDLVVDLEAAPEWRITDVRYWGLPSDRWHLPFLRHGDLNSQLAELARTLPESLSG